MMKEIDIQVQKMQRVAHKMNPKRPTPRLIVIKMAKVKYKEKILKAEKERQLVTYKGALIRLSAERIGMNYSK